MGLSANQAALNLHSYYGVPYGQIELTPMIGGNDTSDETFTIADVTTVSAFAKQNGLSGLHFWSFDRDTDCAPGIRIADMQHLRPGGDPGLHDAIPGQHGSLSAICSRPHAAPGSFAP
jgi:hypothetical protein